MTWEEAVARIQDHMEHHGIGKYPHIKLAEALEMALSALTPPTQEQMERVWPGCEVCKDGEIKIHIPEFRAMAVCNQHMDHEAFTLRLQTAFCPTCGRPLTPEAWEELRKRWEALHGE